jgi:MFS family permease
VGPPGGPLGGGFGPELGSPHPGFDRLIERTTARAGVGRRKLLSRYGTLFRKPSFLAFLAAGSLQFAAPTAVLVVLAFTVTFAYPSDVRTNYAALALAFLGLAATLPSLAAAFFSGPLADRYDRGSLMRAVNLGSILSMVALVADLVYAPGTHIAVPGPSGFYLPLWLLLLYPGWAAIAVTTTLFRPPFNTSVPRLVETSELGLANGAIYAVAAGASTAATISVGVLLTLGSSVYALGVAFALFFGTQVALLLIHADLSVTRRTPPRSVWTEAREGYAFLVGRRGLFELTILGLVVNFLTAVAMVELALYIESWLGLSSGIWYGAMIAASTAGVAVGFLVTSHLRFEPRAGRTIIFLTLVLGATLIALAVVHFVWLALPIIFVYGMMSGMIVNIFLSTVQATVPDEMMGRVFSADEVGSFALIPIGQFAGGLFVLALRVQGTYLLAGGMILAFAGVMLAFFGALRRLAYQPRTANETSGTIDD